MDTTTQAAFNSVWELPYAQRSTIGAQVGRSLIALSAIAITLVGSRVISSYITGTTAVVVYLGSIITLLGAQLNVVLKERLHPRGLVDSPATNRRPRL